MLDAAQYNSTKNEFKENLETLHACCNSIILYYFSPGRGLSCGNVGDAHWKSLITPLKETNLGLAQALFDLQKVHFKMDSKSGVVKNQHISAS